MVMHTTRPDLSQLAVSHVAHTWSSSGVYDRLHTENEVGADNDGQVAGYLCTNPQQTLTPSP